MRQLLIAVLALALIQAAYAAAPNLVSPADSATWASSFDVLFEYTVTDVNTVENCSLIVDGEVRDTDESITHGISQYLTAELVNASHTWQVSCTDDSLDTEVSGTRSVDVSYVTDEPLTINNIGQAGFHQISQEYTSLRTVILTLGYNSSAQYCRYRNSYEEWSAWESCVSPKQWLLTDGNGLKTVWAAINHSEDVEHTYDTIYLDKTGQGLDVTPPQAPIVEDSGDYTNTDSQLYVSWSGAYDRESDILNIPLIYHVRVNNTNLSSWTQLTDSQVEAGEAYLDVSISEDSNYTIEIQVTNSGNLTNSSGSDGIVVDLTPPSPVSISSSHDTSWTSQNDISFNWSFTDTYGVYAYSFRLDSNDTTIPDNIPEGEVGILDQKTSHDFYDRNSAEYYFHVKARDIAGNWGNESGDVSHSAIIRIDVTVPTIPRMVATSGNSSGGSITFNWSESTDLHSGVSGYFLQVASDSLFENIIFNQSVGDVLNYTVSVPTDGAFHGRVKAIDNVGMESLYSDIYETDIDISPPDITFQKPSGVVVNSPKLVVETDERSTCYYDGTVFRHTNSTYHEQKLSVSTGAHIYSIICTDTAGLSNTTTISFTYDDTETLSSGTLSLDTTYYTGVLASAQVELVGTVPLGEVSPSSFALQIDGDDTDISVKDLGGGNYSVSFKPPSVAGSYALNLTVDGLTFTDTIDVSNVYLTMRYRGSLVPVVETLYMFSPVSDYYVGLATDSDNYILNSSSSEMRISADPGSGAGYLFFTSGEPVMKNKQDLLGDQAFLEVINPSFGRRLTDTFHYYSTLSYLDIDIVGDRELSGGRYTLLIKNLGLDTDDDTQVQVTII